MHQPQGKERGRGANVVYIGPSHKDPEIGLDCHARARTQTSRLHGPVGTIKQWGYDSHCSSNRHNNSQACPRLVLSLPSDRLPAPGLPGARNQWTAHGGEYGSEWRKTSISRSAVLPGRRSRVLGLPSYCWTVPVRREDSWRGCGPVAVLQGLWARLGVRAS